MSALASARPIALTVVGLLLVLVPSAGVLSAYAGTTHSPSLVELSGSRRDSSPLLDSADIAPSLEPRQPSVGSIPVGATPDAVGYDPANGDVYVANGGSDNVTVINATQGEVVVSISVGAYPDGIAYDAANGNIYEVNDVSDNVSVICGATNAVIATVPVGAAPYGVAYDGANGYIYVADNGSNNVTVINGTSNEVLAQIPVGGGPHGIAYDPANGDLYVANWLTNNVTVINGTTESVAGSVAMGPGDLNLDGVAYDGTTGDVYVTNAIDGGDQGVAVVNGTPGRLVGWIPVGAGPVGIASDAANGYLYVANWDSNDLSVIETATETVVGSLPAGSEPIAVGYDSTNHFLYVADEASDAVSVLTPSVYPVTFAENGLPLGSEWYVNVSGQPSRNATGSSVTMYLLNGSYPYSIGCANASWAAPNGSFLVSGNPVDIQVAFHLVTYPVTVYESGLPDRALATEGWSAEVGGRVQSTKSNTSTVLSLPNGSYDYLVFGPSGYVVTAASTGNCTAIEPRTVIVCGGPSEVHASFAKGRTAVLTFAAKELAKNQEWCVEVEQLALCSSAESIRSPFLTAGSYTFSVVSPLTGQNVTGKIGETTLVFSDGVIQTIVLQKNTKVDLTFRYAYAVIFTERGLPAGITWSVTVAGVTVSNLSGDPIHFSLTNGTHSYHIGAEAGFKGTGLPARAAIRGEPSSVAVTFVKR